MNKRKKKGIERIVRDCRMMYLTGGLEKTVIDMNHRLSALESNLQHHINKEEYTRKLNNLSPKLRKAVQRGVMTIQCAEMTQRSGVLKP